MQELFNVNFNANLKLFLRLSNCASVGGKNFDHDDDDDDDDDNDDDDDDDDNNNNNNNNVY